MQVIREGFLFCMNDQSLKKKIDADLTTNQEVKIIGDLVMVDIFRGSAIRGNRTRMAVLTFSRADVLEAASADTIFELVSTAEAALNLPLVPDMDKW